MQRMLFSAVLVTAFLFMVTSASAHVIYLGANAAQVQAEKCHGHLFTVRDFKKHARYVYRGTGKITKAQQRRTKAMHICQHSFRARKAVGRIHTAAYRAWKSRRAYAREWNYWSGLFIPACTWYGESGPGPQFASWRYTKPNAIGSSAYGKYQMMPGTYHAYAKYHDWSPLDQEIAAHRLYWAQGVGPWQAC